MSYFQFKLRARRFLLLLFALSLAFTVWFGGVCVPSSKAWSEPRAAIAQSVDVGRLVQSGIDRYNSGLFLEAIGLWSSAYEVYEATEDLAALAVVSENLARAYQQLGEPAEALVYWDRAIAVSSDAATTGRLLTEQAQAYSQLGQPRRAIAILCGSRTDECVDGSALRIAEAADDALVQVAVLGSLGEAYRLLGDEEASIRYLERGLTLSRAAGSALESAILNGLGTVYVRKADISYRRAGEARVQDELEAADLQARGDESNERAIAYLQQSYDIATAQQNAEAQVRSLLSLIPVKARAGDVEAVGAYRRAVSLAIAQLPDSQVKAFALLKLADLLEVGDVQGLGAAVLSSMPIQSDLETEMALLLNQALAIGEETDNQQVVAFALGKLGYLDERAKRYEAAMARTQEARLVASRTAAAKESLYLWDWQMGRILNAVGNENAAKQAYAQAVALLEQIRAQTLGTSQDLQFDFRDTVEPVYRQYAALDLDAVPSAVALQQGAPAFEVLDRTLTTIDALRVAELQSYFANDCIIAPVTTRVDALNDGQRTAAISTAILAGSNFGEAGGGQLVAIASLPDGSKQVARIEAHERRVTETALQFRVALERGWVLAEDYDQEPGKQLYRWLIEPFETALAETDTIVFANDGPLRNVPMAALFDGEQYLVERFAVAMTPSLTLTAPERVARPTELSALLMGVSDRPEVPDRAFGELVAVQTELDNVARVLPNSKVLLNEDFSKEALRRSLAESDYRILHVATHGLFGFDPNDNFVVLGAKRAEAEQFNQLLTIGELDEIIRETSGPTRKPIELLTLTACETAVGDTRATLGLAGIAVRAGVRSAIATLWAVEDASSAQLISNFYTQLKNPELTKAKALQQAQIEMIRSEIQDERHPYRWAAFVLIGNWL